jgi:DNA mismatch repair ATPase MutL
MTLLEILNNIDELVSHNIDIDLVEIKQFSFLINTSLRIKGKGRRSKVDYNVLDSKKETKINQQLNKLAKKQILELLCSFGYNIDKYIEGSTKNNSKITNINDKKKNDKNNNNNKEKESKKVNKKTKTNNTNLAKNNLSEEDLNMWTNKSHKVFAKQITELKKIKKQLEIKKNDDLKNYIKEFDNELDLEKDVGKIIIPNNINDFIEFMKENYINKSKKAG